MPTDAVYQQNLDSKIDHELHEITSSSMKFEYTHGNEGTKFFEVSLPHNCEFTGYLEQGPQGEVVAVGENLGVPSQFERNGIGARLVRGFAAVAKEQGAAVFRSCVISSTALRIIRKVFGESQIQFSTSRDFPSGQGLGFEQAHQILIDAENRSNDGEIVDELEKSGLSTSAYVKVNLDQIDTTGWEMPEFVD